MIFAKRYFKKMTLFASLLGLFLVVSHASALTITPARLELVSDPGKEIQSQFLVINDEKESRTFYTSTANFESQGETGAPQFVNSKEGLASWVSVVPSITLKPNESRSIPFTIKVPTSADAGGNFAALFLSTLAPSPVSGGQVSVGAKIGMLVLLRVNGNVKEGGGILGFTTLLGKHFFTALPIDFSYRFQNSGGDRVNPTGTVTVRNMIWLKSAVLSANPAQGNVLPGSIRKFLVSWDSAHTDVSDMTPTGFFSHVSYEWNHFAFGYYHARLDLAYGATTGIKSGATTWLFVIPWHLLIVVLLGAILLIGIASRGLGAYNRYIIAKAQARS
jgi:hypothetical protein